MPFPCISIQIYINFHRQSLLTDSDRRKYKELFAKVIANEVTTSLPVLSAMSSGQSKAKFIKGPATINMPTNLSILIENETSTSAHATITNNFITHSNESSAASIGTANANLWMNCSDVPRQTLPVIIPSVKSSNKAQLARQVTNVIKRHNFEARQQITDKII